MMGMTRPGTFTAGPTVRCHIYRKHPYINTAANRVRDDVNTPFAAWFAGFLDRQVLQSISSSVKQGGSLEGNEQLPT